MVKNEKKSAMALNKSKSDYRDNGGGTIIVNNDEKCFVYAFFLNIIFRIHIIRLYIL